MKEFSNDFPNLSLIEDSLLEEENGGLNVPRKDYNISRRQILALLGTLSLNACSSEKPDDFDPEKYPVFTEDDYIERDAYFNDAGLRKMMHFISKDLMDVDLQLVDMLGMYVSDHYVEFRESLTRDELQSYLDMNRVDLSIRDFYYDQDDFDITFEGNGKFYYIRTYKDELIIGVNTHDSMEMSLGFDRSCYNGLVGLDVYRYNGDSTMAHNQSTYSFLNDGSYGILGDSFDWTYYPVGQPPVEVNGFDSLLVFLKKCKSSFLIYEYFRNGKLSISDISSDQDLIELYRLVPAAPSVHCAMLKSVLDYADKDDGYKDEFRHPINTFRSGWADCDDYANINYLWAKMHGYDPSYYRVPKHVFVYYVKSNGTIVVLNNDSVVYLDDDETLDEYVSKYR